MSSVGKHIRARRLKLGLSQEQLAARVYTTRQTISNYETGRSNPDLDTLVTLAEALDTDASALLYGEPKHSAGDGALLKKNQVLRFVLVIGAVIAVYAVIALLVLNWEQKNEASWQELYYEGTDPLSYVKWYDSRYGGEALEYEVLELDGQMLVLSSGGQAHYFYPSDNGWTRAWNPIPVDGTLYTAPGYGLYPWHARLMDGAGTVYEPAYEIAFSDGYLPVFAFDVSAGQEYRCLLYGVDDASEMRFDAAVTFSGVSDWTMTEKERINENTEFYRQHTLAAVERTGTGPAFLAAFGAWREAVRQTKPDAEKDTAALGIDGSFVLTQTWDYPPALILEKTGDNYLDMWMLNEYEEYLYGYQNGTAQFEAKAMWTADLSALYAAEKITPELLRRAAGTVYYSMYREVNYGHTWQWTVTVPDELRDLWAQTFRELNGTG